MDNARDQDAYVKRDGKVIAANTVPVIQDVHFMGNARMEHVFAKLVSMESIVHFQLVILWVQNKEPCVVAMDHVNLALHMN